MKKLVIYLIQINKADLSSEVFKNVNGAETTTSHER